MCLEKDILNALQLVAKLPLDSKNQYETYFSKLYPFTTENLSGYFTKLDLKGKDILTTGSSGDQILNSIMLGCKSVTCFDINPFAKYYYELKKVAIQHLSYDEFISWFCQNEFIKDENNKIFGNFNVKFYYRISPYLSAKTRKFWDSLYLEFSNYNIRERLFFDDEEKVEVLKKVNSYLDEVNYYKLRKRLDEVIVDFIECDVKELPKKIVKKYDYIFLSNIMKHINLIYKQDRLENLKQLILELDNYLKTDGEIELCYLYNYKKSSKKIRSIYDIDKIKNKLGENRIYLLKVKSIVNFLKLSLKKDYVIMCKKNN